MIDSPTPVDAALDAGCPAATVAPGECPACLAAQSAVDALVQQLAASAESTQSATAWLAVCNTHAWQLAQNGTIGRQIVLARLRAALAQLDGAAAAGRRAPAGADVCPFCAAMAHAAASTVEAVAPASQVFCLPHLCLALLQARSRERVHALAAAARAQGNTLEQELSELIRKSDYRFRDEPRGPEATSWQRAAQMLVGAPAVQWSLRREPEIDGQRWPT